MVRKKAKSEVSLDDSVHGKALFEKIQSSGDRTLKGAYDDYLKYREKIGSLKILKNKAVNDLVEATNEYRKKVLYVFEKRQHSGQEGLRSSILEEFLFHLFRDLMNQRLSNNLKSKRIGKANIYINLSFTPHSFKDLYKEPHPYVHTKDQDFTLGCLANLSVGPFGDENHITTDSIIIPVVAIECKTYLERNMLDSCASTAHRIKLGMPYCMYIVISEYMKMDDAYPELTEIDEVFVLCKARNSERQEFEKKNLPPHPIDSKLVQDLFSMVKRHLNRIWWSPDEALRRGRIICRP